MIQISEHISVKGFENKQEYDNWLKEQDEQMPKSVMLKMFKWFLMRLEENVKENKFDKKVMDAIDKYSMRIIRNKIMSENDVFKFVREAQGLEES